MATIPIYWGASKYALDMLLPDPNAIIWWDDFPSVAALASYLQEVHNSSALLNKHLGWTRKQFSPAFRALMNRTQMQRNVACSLCNHVRAVKYSSIPIVAEPFPTCSK